MSLTTLWNQCVQSSSEKLHQSLSSEFPKLIHYEIRDKQLIENYLDILTKNQEVILPQIINLVHKKASNKELRQYLKIFNLPLGLRYKLAQFIYQNLVGMNEGQILIDSCYIMQQLGTNQYKVLDLDWGCFLQVDVSPSFCDQENNGDIGDCNSSSVKETFEFIRSRCNLWISIGYQRNILPGFFYRLHPSKHSLLFFHEYIEPKLSLHNYIETFSLKLSRQEMDDEAALNYLFHLMISLCNSLEICHNKGLPHLNLTPANILLVSPDSAGSNDTPYEILLSSILLTDSGFTQESMYTAPEISQSSFRLLTNSQLFSMDIFSVGMIFLDIIRGRSRSSTPERRVTNGFSPSTVDWDQTAKGELIDWAFSESILPKRKIYPLMSLIDLCLSENPTKRPTIHYLLDKLIDAYQYCTTNPSIPISSPSQLLESSSNLSNLAIGDYELGHIENARNRWILSLVNHQSNTATVWNLNLFRWRIGEITPMELIEILSQHQCQYYPAVDVDSTEILLINSLIQDVVRECMLPMTPINCMKYTTSLFSSIECWNLHKSFLEINDQFLMKIESQLGTYQINFNPEKRKFTEKYEKRPTDCFPSSFGFTSTILCLHPYSDHITVSESKYSQSLTLIIGEILNCGSNIFFVERPVGCEFLNLGGVPQKPQQQQSLVMCLLLEGRWATSCDLDSTGNRLDEHSSSNDIQDDSNDSQSTPSDQFDLQTTPAPPTRHYIIVIGSYNPNDLQKSFHVLSVIDIFGISADQRPRGMKLIASDALCISGSGGLLALITLPTSLRKQFSLNGVHLNCDEILKIANIPNTKVLAANANATATANADFITPPCSKCFHPIESTIVDISFSSRTQTLVSGDSLGYLCLWKQSISVKGPFDLIGFPLQVGGRIQRIVHSIECMSTIVSTDWKLLFIRVQTDSLVPTMYIHSILDSITPSSHLISPPQYVTQFVGELIHVWKMTIKNNNGLQRGNFEEDVQVKDDQVFDSMVDEEGIHESVIDQSINKVEKQGMLQIELMLFINPDYATKKSNQCRFRFQSVELNSTLIKKKKDLRLLNERIFHLINDDEFVVALDIIQSERRLNHDLCYSNDLLTWSMSISEKVHLNVLVVTENNQKNSQSPQNKNELQSIVRFISIEGLETSQSPSTNSEIDMISAISSSMKLTVDGPIFPTALSSSDTLIAIAPISKLFHSNNTNHNVLSSLSLLSFPIVWIIDTHTMNLLYTIESKDILNQYEVIINPYYPQRNGERGEGGVFTDRVTALRFSKSGRYLLIAQTTASNKSSLISIWCTSSRSCVGQLVIRDKDVVDVRWNNSDTLISIFYSEDKFLNYFLDWPIVEVVYQPQQLSSWICGKSPYTLSLSLLDTLVLTEKNLDGSLFLRRHSHVVGDNGIDNSNLINGNEFLLTHQYLDYIYETEYTWLWTQEITYSCSSHIQFYETLVDMNKWIFDEIRAWVSSDLSNYNFHLRQHQEPHISLTTYDKSQGNKVCLIVGDPQIGKSYLMTKIASEFEDRTLARIWIPRNMLLNSTPNSVAFHMIIILSHQLRDFYGESYGNIVLRELSNQMKSMKKNFPREPVISNNAVNNNSNNNNKPKSHHRHFSTASSSLGSIDLNHHDDDDDHEDYEMLLWFTSLTLKHESTLLSTMYKIPSISALPIQILFKCFIEIPLKELPPPVKEYIVFVDGLDIRDCSTTHNHYQVVLHHLIHSTPSWCKIVLTSRVAARFHFYLANVNTATINLNDEKHQPDVFSLLSNNLLIWKRYQGDITSGIELLYPSIDISMKNCIQLYDLIPFDCDQLQLQNLLYFYDSFHLTFQEEFFSPHSEKFLRSKRLISLIAAAYESPSVVDVANSLGDLKEDQVRHLIESDLSSILSLKPGLTENSTLVIFRRSSILNWIRSCNRVGEPFSIDIHDGHNAISALYLKHCSNKSIAVDHSWQSYLKTYGPSHLHRSSRGLTRLTKSIRKIDETSGIKGPLPQQLGYLENLQELYARRVGIYGPIPKVYGCLQNLRVLSMGNNKISGSLPSSLGNLTNLQRIVLHQNKLSGPVPSSYWELGCIINLAGNPALQHGPDVSIEERSALTSLYNSTNGSNWTCNTGWTNDSLEVAKWYKVGVLGSRVHSIVMSSNNMVGTIPSDISKLTQLRMIELATMPGLFGPISDSICSLTSLRRLCICRCGLTGRIPTEIGNLINLEELQLFGNNLTGKIPDSFSQLTSLRLLSLGEYTGGNNFTPGPIPTCLSSLVKLEALFLSNCHLKGPLPDWIGDLSELRQLDLQRNNLRGTLPTSIGKLGNMLYLNLKDNVELYGPLPVQQLSRLTRLNRLSLVHCRFTVTDEVVNELQSHLPRCRLWL